jgi:hypothetical protein
VFAQSNPPIPAPAKSTQIEQKQTRQVESRTDGKKQPPPLIDPQKKVDQKNGSAANDDKKSACIWWKLDANWTTAIFTVVLALAAIAQVYVYWKQSELMEKGLKETRAANVTAKFAAEISQRAVEMAGKNAERQMRAYLHISILTIKGFDENKPPSARIRLTNYGQTPAYETRCRLDVIVRSEPIGTDFVLPDIRNDWGTRSDVFPNTTVASEDRRMVVQDAKEKFRANEISGIRSGQLTIYVIAEVSYIDAFKEKRSTYACSGVRASLGELKKLTSDWPDLSPSNQTMMIAPVGNLST